MALFFPWLIASARELPFRLMIALAISIGLAGTVPLTRLTLKSQDLILLCTSHLIIGAAIGYIASLLVAAFMSAGELTSRFMGLSTDQQGTVFGLDATSSVGRFLTLFALLVFLLSGGHHLLLRAITRSFASLPASGESLPAWNGAALIHLTGAALVLAFQLASPVLLTVVLVTAALALAGRSAGQASSLVTGFPLRALTGLVALFIFLNPLAKALQVTTLRLTSWLDMLLGS